MRPPAEDSGHSLLTVLGIDGADEHTLSARTLLSVVADTTVAYISGRRLYLATFPGASQRAVVDENASAARISSTVLHAVDLTAPTPRHLGSRALSPAFAPAVAANGPH